MPWYSRLPIRRNGQACSVRYRFRDAFWRLCLLRVSQGYKFGDGEVRVVAERDYVETVEERGYFARAPELAQVVLRDDTERRMR